VAEQAHSRRLYLVVYVALLALLIATVGFSFVDIGRRWNNGIAIGIACAKGLLIILFFMHLRYERWLTWFFAGAGFVWLAILLTLSISEYLTRNHPAGMSPKGEPVYLSAPAPDAPPLLAAPH